MERLTFEGNFCDIAQCRDSHCRINGTCTQKQVWERLKEYEDTGTTPEEALSMSVDIAMINAVFRTADFERMKHLAEADKEHRVVVLPCKDWLDIVFGEQTVFYGIDTDYIEEPIREISVDNADRISWYDGWKTVFLKGTDENGLDWEFCPDEIGKTVFLTREEAEKAAEERNGNQ